MCYYIGFSPFDFSLVVACVLAFRFVADAYTILVGAGLNGSKSVADTSAVNLSIEDMIGSP